MMMTPARYRNFGLLLIQWYCLLGIFVPSISRADEFEIDWGAIYFPRPHVKVDLGKFPGWEKNFRTLQDASAQLAIRYADAYAAEFCPQVGLPKNCDLFVGSRKMAAQYLFSIKDRRVLAKVNADTFDTSKDRPITQTNLLDGVARRYLLEKLAEMPRIEGAKKKAWQQKYYNLVRKLDEVERGVNQSTLEDSGLKSMTGLDSLQKLTARNYLWIGVSVLLSLAALTVVRRKK